MPTHNFIFIDFCFYAKEELKMKIPKKIKTLLKHRENDGKFYVENE